MAAVGCALAAFCYAEFAAMAPVAGSAYTYTYTTLGEIFAWIIGWDLILEYSMGCATVASAWSRYLNEFLAVLGMPRIPPALAQIRSPPWKVGRPAVVQLARRADHGLGYDDFGARHSRKRPNQCLLVIVKLAVVLFIIAVGIGYVDSRNWTQVPVTERMLPQEHVLPGLVKEYLCRPEARLRIRPRPNSGFASRPWNGNWPPATA